MHQLRLHAADSRFATEEELAEALITSEQIPFADGRLMAHQAATVRALRFSEADIVINTAMTGDGKTLAGRLPLLNDKRPTFTMYPTNELAHDQAQSLGALLSEWSPPAWSGKQPYMQIINAAVLDEEQAAFEEFTRHEALRARLDSDTILTNPDIFHYIMSFAYRQHGTARDSLIGELAHRYQLFVFDEFHLFGVAETASVMIAMLLLLRTANLAKPLRFLFLSATPQDMLIEMANRVGIECERVGGTDYEHGRSEPPPGYRRVLRPVDLTLYAGQLEAWVETYTEGVILPFFADHQPAATGLIIANSVATAYRVYAYLQPICNQNGIRVGLNTGATPFGERGRDTGDYDLIVATSTVDVGIDFRINLLIFESMDAASHIQRLGRLGRHDSDVLDHPFEAFAAHALVPQWVVDGMAQKFPDGSAVRSEYESELGDLLPPLQQFQPYVYRWAGVQAGNILREISRFDIKSQYGDIFEPLKADFAKLFGKSVKKYFALFKNEQIETLRAAASFRGGSPFNVLLVHEGDNNKQIISYNLIPLLLKGELGAVSLQRIRDDAQQGDGNSTALERSKPLAAYRLLGWRAEARRIEITLDRTLDEAEWETVVECQGFRFAPLGVPELHALNNELETRTLVALCVRNKPPDMVRRILRLGYFELLAFRDGAGVTGCAAFGRDALLLDSILYRFKQSANALYW